MSNQKLSQLQEIFFKRYPEGFESPEMKGHAKKHKLWEMSALVNEQLGKENFNEPEKVVENAAKIITKSSLVSVFEKVKFRDFMKGLSQSDRIGMATILFELLHGNQAEGFVKLVDFLNKEKLAKWPLLTILPTYQNPEEEVFIKPTTAKKVLAYFDVSEFQYSPKPSYDFYKNYRSFVNHIRTGADERVARSNPEFLGFLMIAIDLAAK